MTLCRTNPEERFDGDEFPSLVVRLNELEPLIESTAVRLGISARLLRLRVGLQLPKLFPTLWGQLTAEREEIERVASTMQRRGDAQAIAPGWTVQAAVEEVDEGTATHFHEHLHYLGAARRGGMHFGLSINGRIVALATFSPFDLVHLRKVFRTPFELLTNDQIAVVSRVVCTEDAPKNSISYLLARAIRLYRAKHRSAVYFVTYVNPNLGFHGSSYRANEWHLLGEQRTASYCYLDGMYVTRRMLGQLVGSINSHDQQRILANRLCVSPLQLAPMLVFGKHVDAQK
jgi:hypothetical protein